MLPKVERFMDFLSGFMNERACYGNFYAEHPLMDSADQGRRQDIHGAPPHLMALQLHETFKAAGSAPRPVGNQRSLNQ
jgi:hypothetical protein